MSGYAQPASVKQENYINSLLRNVKDLSPLTTEQRSTLEDMKAAKVITKDDASYLISGLLKCPAKPVGEMAKPGYYKAANGDFLNVVENRQKTRTYAKRLEVTKAPGQRAKARWVYAPGAAAGVAHVTPLSLEEAAKFGHLNGVCLICCKALTDPESVRAGIGPVCRKKIGR